MNPGVIKAYIVKELTELVRSRLILMVYLMPTMILFLYGYGIRMEVTHARTLIIDYDQSRASQRLIGKFEHSKYFEATVASISEKEAFRRIRQARADMVIVIPESFEQRLLQAQRVQIGVFVDAAFPSRASTMESYVQGVVMDAASAAVPGMSEGMDPA